MGLVYNDKINAYELICNSSNKNDDCRTIKKYSEVILHKNASENEILQFIKDCRKEGWYITSHDYTVCPECVKALKLKEETIRINNIFDRIVNS